MLSYSEFKFFISAVAFASAVERARIEGFEAPNRLLLADGVTRDPMMRQRMSFRASGLAGSLDSLVEDPNDFSMV